ncbi:hypothetical protein [Mesorhizobium sp. CAU 1741]|uniref:hypothetical protein n=1 Tax=Mesorhizobium sp. CAU 1741 TaxID=3140366 RepID=UPI00325A7979
MTVKLIIIMLTAAAFGWGFSNLVEHSDQSMRPGMPQNTCDEWQGDDCSTQFDRQP